METRPYAEADEEGDFNTNNTLGNFTLPFEFRDASQLNTSSFMYQLGYYGNYYPQTGYTVDLIPNLASFWYAEKVQACQPLLQVNMRYV